MEIEALISSLYLSIGGSWFLYVYAVLGREVDKDALEFETQVVVSLIFAAIWPVTTVFTLGDDFRHWLKRQRSAA